MTTLRAAALVAAMVAGFVAAVAPAQAQTVPKDWPNRPVKFIIPFGPGAGADIGARLLIEPLQARWGKPLVIENRPGGDSMVAIQAFLAANDDHTLLWGPSGNFTVHPFLYQKLPYDPADLIPIARFSNTILAVGTPAAMNFKDLKDFVARGLQEKGKWNGTAVPGVTDFAFDYFAKTAGLEIQKIAYKDTVQAATDLGEGRIQVYSSSYAILRPQTEAGRIKVLAVMGPQRAPSLPDIPVGNRGGLSQPDDGRPGRAVRVEDHVAGADGQDRRRHPGGGSGQGDRAEARNHGADAQSRRSEGVQGLDRGAAQADRHDRPGDRHQEAAIGAIRRLISAGPRSHAARFYLCGVHERAALSLFPLDRATRS